VGRAADGATERRRRAALGAIAAGAVFAVLIPIAMAGADNGTSGLIGFEVQAAAPGLELVFDSPAIPTPTHPVFTGTLPEATSTMGTGPSTEGFTAIFWPGPLAGNLGTTLQQLNQLCAPGSIPLPPGANCLPVPQSLKDIMKGKNDPVRADAKNSGPQDASYGGSGALYMRAHADDQGATSDAGVTSLQAPPLVNIGSVTAHSNVQLAKGGGVVSGDAVGAMGGLVVGLGLPGLPVNLALLSIDSVNSTVHVESNGTKGSGKGSTVASGVKVAGMPASIDQSGLHLGPTTQPLNSLLNPLLSTVTNLLSQLKFKVHLVQPVETTQGTSETFTLGGVIIEFTTPDGSMVKITAGKAAAAADSSPAEALPALPTLPVTEPSLGSAGGTALSSPSISDTGSPLGAAPAAGTTSTPQTIRNAAFLPGGKPLAAGVLLVALAAAGLIGFGLKRLSDDVLAVAPPGTTCPNEGKSP
jgi:hypothetical protein